MEGRSTTKIKGGKMLRINIKYENDRLKAVSVCGDFFLYPEEKIEILEKELSGVRFADLKKKIRTIINDNGIVILGFSPEDLSQAIIEAK